MTWMIYGANGYTGELIAREASKRGMAPILAGRNAGAVERLAQELGLPARVFELTGDGFGPGKLQGVRLVLHCAGPFSRTSAPMLQACLEAKAHYLDITGELAVLEHAFSRSAAAAAAGIVVCPGVGMDVVPTDCIALALHAALPDAVSLALGFDTRSRLSRGTLRSTLEGIGKGARVRRNAKLQVVPWAHGVRRIDFGKGEVWAMTVPWGDLESAFHSTGIPNIEVYMACPRAVIEAVRLLRHAPALWQSRSLHALAERAASSTRGPSAEQRSAAPTYVWGEVVNAHGRRRTARLRTANGYDLTVSATLYAVQALLRAEATLPGCTTPAKLLGTEWVTTLPGSGPLLIE
ncbi:MAG TPA: saccharopine dehydrogenase NADP-binding domain-containing protein [Polyangiaceae bacterium]|nr:saccharopine dehydrogenase NADP-binding domain-containing protein [Polyangiaceae bacterium]